MNVIAAVRPDSWNFPLFMHVVGATILVGGLLTGASVLALAKGEATLLRFGYWSLVAVSVPGWIVMRIGAQWIYTEAGWDDAANEPAWLATGAAIGDVGGLVLLVALVVGVYRLREGKGAGLLKATLALSLILLAAYLVAVWAMAGKPD